MSLTAGTRLGPYEILSPIGAGGMGEVYRARDTKLDRDVAIKVLPDKFAEDAQRLARFEREAKVLASLSHPNIASIHGFEESDGVNALVLELVEGPTLAERIEQGPIPADEALAIAKQIAEALEAGHESGVVHRDLKPANIKLKDDATVKVLDYGLAKALAGNAPGGPDAEPSQSPTLTRQTEVGVILGTAAYMSPEQAKGKAVDRRADIWSFGAVLYEMLAGQRAFGGDNVSERLAAVIRAEPDFDALPAAIPESMRLVLRLCLQKSAADRFQSIGDVRLALGGAFETPIRTARLAFWQRPVPALVLAVAMATLGALAVWSLDVSSSPPSPLVSRFVVPVPDTEPLEITVANTDVAISPDGSTLVYVATSGRQLFVRPMNQLEATPLRGTEAGYTPFFSPDSQWIGYRDWDDRALSKISVQGGPPLTVYRLPPNDDLRGASWSEDDTIFFGGVARETGLQRVPAGGGEPTVITTPDVAKGEADHVWPDVLPGGRNILFTVVTGSDRLTGTIEVLSIESGERKVLIENGSHPRYVPTGHIVYGVDNALRAVTFDLQTLEVTSNPVPVVERVITKGSGAVDFSVSSNGSLVYVSGSAHETKRRSLVWVDREGREELLAVEQRSYDSVRLSPDATRAVVAIKGDELDLWIYDFSRETFTRLTFGGENLSPVWTVDGDRIVFRSLREGEGVFGKAGDGTGDVERLLESSGVRDPLGFHPNGRQLLFRATSPETFQDIGIVSLDGDSTVSWIARTKFREASAALSPDGKWVAYQSDESGEDRIYVQPIPDIDAGKWQVSTGRGIVPVWRRDGREIFYVGSDGMMAVPVETEPTFTPGRPVHLFSTDLYAIDAKRSYDVSPDGRRFLILKESGDHPEAAEIHVVLNWFDELKRLVPTGR